MDFVSIGDRDRDYGVGKMIPGFYMWVLYVVFFYFRLYLFVVGVELLYRYSVVDGYVVALYTPSYWLSSARRYK